MLALVSLWLGLATFVLAAVMVLHRPAMTDWTVTLVLYFGSPGSLCLAGLTLWAHRNEDSADAGVVARRVQAKVAIGLSVVAAALVYALIIFSLKIMPIDDPARAGYNPPRRRAAQTVAPAAGASCRSPLTANPLRPRPVRRSRTFSANSTWPRFAWPSRSTRISFPGGPSPITRCARAIALRW